ncbi:hypothetical protein Godav_004226 [Gossypium davidsonii]|uniref:Uncharacterized protein n=2 Tax=Gossypium TaxID=3633 RepID=A0A7J8SLT3_GOSDV|nr:hypothetical protein [Gossypium davidsonii]MBA0662197.1 hypothetical protein [Gossypium klotzschianum]
MTKNMIQKYLDNFFNKNPILCKSAAPDQTTAKCLQAKSTASAMLAQAKTKKEYKKFMAEMLNSLVPNSKMINLQHLQSKWWILKMKPLQ